MSTASERIFRIAIGDITPGMDSRDREQISQLHGYSGPRNRRDASSSATPWRHKATPIQTPAPAAPPSQQQQARRSTNPYSGRTGNNLHVSIGNPTARRTTLNQSHDETFERKPKRQKLDSSPAVPGPSKRNGNGYPNGVGRKSLPGGSSIGGALGSRTQVKPRSSLHNGTFIRSGMDQEQSSPFFSSTIDRKGVQPTFETVFDGDDIAEVVPQTRQSSDSADPLDCLPPTSRKRQRDVSIPPSIHPSNHSSTGDSSKRRPVARPGLLVGDGDSTKRVRHEMGKGKEPEVVNVESSEESDIASFTGLPSRQKPAGSSVASKVNLYESLSKNTNAKPAVVDLLQRQKQQGVKDRMKGKQSLRISNPGRQDYIATSPSGFKTEPVPRLQRFPLQDWSIGCHCSSVVGQAYANPCWLIWDGKATFLLMEHLPEDNGERLLEIHLGSNLESLEMTSPNETYNSPIIKIKPSVGTSVKGTLSRHLILSSDHANGLLSLKMTRKHRDWDENQYQVLQKYLSRSAQMKAFHHGSASPGVWEVITRAAEMAIRAQAREDTVSESTATEVVPEIFKSSLETTSVTRPRPKTATYGPRRSTRLSGENGSNNDESDKLASPLDPDELILVYPFSGPGALNVTKSDLARLKPDEFLNDTLIELGLKIFMDKLRAQKPELADQIHVFSSFFYKKLSTKNPEDGFQSVRKWTSKFDVFKKKYLIVPINEHLHWYLVIICNPEYVLQSPASNLLPKATRRSGRISRPQGEAASQMGESSTMINDATSSAAASDPLPAQQESASESHTRSRSISLVPDSTSEGPDHGDQREEQDVEKMIVEYSASHSLLNRLALESDSAIFLPSGSSNVDNFASLALSKRQQFVDHDNITRPNEVDTTISLPSGSPTASDVHMDELDHSMAELSHDDPDIEIDELELQYPMSSPRGRDVELPSFDRQPEGSNLGQRIVAGTGAKNSSVLSSPVPPSTFYARSETMRGKRKASSAQSTGPIHVVEDDLDAQDSIYISDSEQNDTDYAGTRIYTFDSLGSKHPQAIRRLGKYLQMEAADKKGTTDTIAPTGTNARVPKQPNYCDCGIYLLHFALTFIGDPQRSYEVLASQKPKANRRGDYWNDGSIKEFRETFSAIIQEQSEAWKKDKEEKETLKKTEGRSESRAASADSSSDSDIIVEVGPEISANTKKSGIRKANRATRLR